MAKSVLEVFKSLKASSAFNPQISEGIKSRILERAWDECLVLSASFNEDGTKMTVFRGESQLLNGFGHLVEVLAKHDPDLPQNTVPAERLSKLILRLLQKGKIPKTDIKIYGHLRTPDQIWIDFSGRKATVWGICEVKASHISYRESERQLSMLESSLRSAIISIETRKKDHDYLSKIKIEVKNPLKKILVTPAGFKSNIDLLPGWDHQELKFTYNEIIFLAQNIWPDFRPTLVFEDGLMGKYQNGFLASFLKWGAENITRQLPFTIEKPENVFLFACATGKLPTMAGDANFVSQCMEALREILLRYPDAILREEQMGPWEKRFHQSFTKAFGGGKSVANQIALFLTNLRNFSTAIMKICREEKEMNKILARANSFNVIDYCPK